MDSKAGHLSSRSLCSHCENSAHALPGSKGTGWRGLYRSAFAVIPATCTCALFWSNWQSLLRPQISIGVINRRHNYEMMASPLPMSRKFTPEQVRGCLVAREGQRQPRLQGRLAETLSQPAPWVPLAESVCRYRIVA